MRLKPRKAANSASTITVRPKPGRRTRALVTFAGRTEEAAIGRSGTTSRKREGDGATPIASMRLVGGYIRHDRVTLPPTALPLRFTPRNLLWCDEPRHALYNRPVSAPFKPSHEKMRRDDGLYDICLVMDWNLRSRKRNGGSAIFFHLAKPGYQPTEGCVAVSLPAMKRLLRFMRRGTVVRVTG
ncbi:L,D-transpeptidase family protein [Rhizobium herbae]|uniref:L,D-peptidoglycan transpeptidase YkuD (ErfK/YbiS/YcfS/YnhG family) n=1 Tax=Rhizobium herbae TaxID=508661 RepID=A0ABS4EKI2_9HYPH|nr:L,D-transpeptidase family protein [Rhizobium herbae]MBP1858435.1 L,D-peptidoglycan transpeptidase YkuD (ErfK/YbiS/YcfS/YnhG family) [Rhizobium herbae]